MPRTFETLFVRAESIYCLLASLTLDEDLPMRGELPMVICDFHERASRRITGLLDLWGGTDMYPRLARPSIIG